MATTHQDLIRKLQVYLNTRLLERQREVAGAMTALAAGEHLLLIGPRGTAKTLQCELMNSTLQGSTYFYWLLTRFSQPEELFGPVSYKGLRNDTFARVITGKLPEAHVAFLDEIFKANSAILNALLTLLNERRFHNGIGAVDCPLIMLMGASNELPEGEELDALWDRFMLRYWVSDVRDRENRVKLVSDDLTAQAPTLTLDDLKRIRVEADAITFPDEMAELLVDVHDAAEKEGHDISDRRLRKSVAILKAYAYVQQEAEVTSDHFEILTDCFWQKPDARADLAALIRKLANPIGAKAQQILDAAKEEFRKIPFTDNDRQGMKQSAVAGLITEVNGKLKKSIAKLEKLTNGKPNTRVDEAVAECKAMHTKAIELATKVMVG
jgi:MoxR-like ATPase